MLPSAPPPPSCPLPVRFPSRCHLLLASRAEGASLSVLVPTPEWYAGGTVVQVEVSFGDCPARYVLEGAVASVSPATWERKSHQLAVCFQGAHKRHAAEMVALCAGEPPEMGTARRPRFPTAVRCLVRTGTQRLAGEVRDLSLSGAFVALPSSAALQAGDTVQLVLGRKLLGLGGTRLEGRVVWRGEKQGTPGFGAHFLGIPAQVALAVRRYLGQGRPPGTRS